MFYTNNSPNELGAALRGHAELRYRIVENRSRRPVPAAVILLRGCGLRDGVLLSIALGSSGSHAYCHECLRMACMATRLKYKLIGVAITANGQPSAACRLLCDVKLPHGAQQLLLLR